MTPEFSRPLALDRVGPVGLTREIEASPAECDGLAARLAIPGVRSLRAHLTLARLAGEPRSGHFAMEGRITGLLIRVCVVTLDDIDVVIDERFRLRLMPEPDLAEDIDPETEDEVGYLGVMVDLGELVAEQLGLTLDPYPRAPGATLPDAAAEPDDHPFASLVGRRGTSAV